MVYPLRYITWSMLHALLLWHIPPNFEREAKLPIRARYDSKSIIKLSCNMTLTCNPARNYYYKHTKTSSCTHTHRDKYKVHSHTTLNILIKIKKRSLVNNLII